MSEIKSNLYDCKHCNGDGTCTNGENGNSCLACVKKNELKKTPQKGLLCGSCGGIGLAEPMTERMNKRMAPILAIYLVVSLLALIAFSALLKSQHFPEILSFSSAIIGTVCGYYFSSKSNA